MSSPTAFLRREETFNEYIGSVSHFGPYSIDAELGVRAPRVTLEEFGRIMSPPQGVFERDVESPLPRFPSVAQVLAGPLTASTPASDSPSPPPFSTLRNHSPYPSNPGASSSGAGTYTPEGYIPAGHVRVPTPIPTAYGVKRVSTPIPVRGTPPAGSTIRRRPVPSFIIGPSSTSSSSNNSSVDVNRSTSASASSSSSKTLEDVVSELGGLPKPLLASSTEELCRSTDAIWRDAPAEIVRKPSPLSECVMAKLAAALSAPPPDYSDYHMEKIEREAESRPFTTLPEPKEDVASLASLASSAEVTKQRPLESEERRNGMELAREEVLALPAVEHSQATEPRRQRRIQKADAAERRHTRARIVARLRRFEHFLYRMAW